MPTVLINSQTENQSEIFHSVAIDDRLGARLATEHLISLGHTAIGSLGVGDGSRSNQQRLEGYRMALAEAGLPQNLEEKTVENRVLSPFVLQRGSNAPLPLHTYS